MAYIISADQDSADDYLVRSSSLGTGGYYWAVGVHYKWNNAASNAVLWRMTDSGSGFWLSLQVQVTTGNCLLVTSGGVFGGSVTLTNGQYAYLGVDYTANAGATLYYWRDNGSDSGMTAVSVCNTGAQLTPTSFGIGYDLAAQRSARGSYSHVRYWNAGETASSGSPLANLGATQWENERTSATPHSGKSAYIIDNWKLITNGNGDNGINFTANGSGSFSADEPSYVSSSSTVVPGIWLSRQNRAFGSARQRYT
jgi:hypothetical protein